MRQAHGPRRRSARSAKRICSAFTVTTDGRYVIDTRGPTDVVMKLFGPDSETALIAEDDDSGVRLPTRGSRPDLIAGDYFVQVRHYNRASGMGNYSILVRKM